MVFGSVPFVLVERCCGFAENKVAVCLFFFISSFVCFFYLFLWCFSGLCLLSLSGGSGRTTCFFGRGLLQFSGCAFGFLPFVFSCCV